ncbi:SigE family RNA polymerase sigma factor [Tessaracoccus terricola]
MSGSTAFDDWVSASQSRLLRYAYLLCADREEARDVVQDVYSRMFTKFDRLHRDGGVDAYATRSVTNEVISRRRRRRLQTVSLEKEPAAPAAVERVPDRVVAWELCRELPMPQRAAVVLRFYEDLDFARIGELLGMPEATARSHVHRALTALRQRLDEEDHR